MDSWPKKTFWLTATVLSYLSNVQPVSAAPARPHEKESFNNASLFSIDFGVSTLKGRDTSIPLRILGVGASIMAGWGSTTYNGGRKPLRDALRADGWDVDMVGSLTCGSMVDNDCEAVAGDILTQILARIPHSINYKPNIVIINGGTNDANGVDPNAASVSTAGERMDDILNALWDADGMSDTCIMLSTLLPTTNANGIVNVPLINSQYRALVTQHAAEGKCIYLAEMWPLGDSEQWFQFDTDYWSTETIHVHPNDKGHSMMASVFYNSIQSAISDNKIVTPGEMVIGNTTCDKVAGTGTDAGGLTQRGSGYDDKTYFHDSEESTLAWQVWRYPANVSLGGVQWKFARLFNPLYDDLLEWVSETSTSQYYNVFANPADGTGNFSLFGTMDGDLNCEDPEGVHFIDMNGDGLDDLVYIDADGNGYLSINQADGERSGTAPTFKRVSDTALIMNTNGVTRNFVVLADIDGDGRGDFGRMDNDGNVQFWRNGGTGDSPSYWQALGQRWTGQNYGSGDENYLGTRFEDINGDGRDDMVWLDSVGAGHMWTNSRSCAKGLEGDGLNVAWREGFYTGTTDQAYKGMRAYVTTEETVLRSRVHFARVYGEENIFGNMPRQDYVFMQHTYNTFFGIDVYQMHIWKNTGNGGTKLKGDGNKYCNMMGHSNGMVDYVWTYSFGTMELWVNRGKGTISDSDPDGYWDYYGTLWTPPENINRKDLHLADWDGDGACDIIWVTPDTGSVVVWLNRYPREGNFESWNVYTYAQSTLSCSESRGLGISDLAVRFADIDGNGWADYLCIAPDSSISGYIHNDDGTFDYHPQIKLSIGKDRANLRFADVNGDGLDDMLWIEKFSGDTYVYYNDGPMDPSQAAGSSFGWTPQAEPAYAGLVAGTCEYFADLNGDGFPDEHYLSEGTFNNKARTSLAPGCGQKDHTGDDSDMTSDLPLPTVPNSTSGGGGTTGSGLPSTGTGCVSGTGSGDCSGLCTYVCARGFCPSPCTCTTTGTYDAGTEDVMIDGYANTGYDDATFTPLCNFACAHQYCPDECLFTDVINPGVTGSIAALPTLDDYLEDVDATNGAFYRYQVPEDPNISVSILYAGDKITFPTDITCADTTSGDGGAFVGCVGDTVEWLFLSLAQDTESLTIESRDTSSSNPTTKYTFTPLPPLVSEEGCSMHCKLEARGSESLNMWTPVGEGMVNDRAHSLHFMHTGKSIVFKATAGSLKTANLEERAETRSLGAALTFEVAAYSYMIEHLYGSSNTFTNTYTPNLVRPLMDAAVDRVATNCLFVASNDSATVSADSIATGFGVEIAPSTSLAVDTGMVDGLSKTCTAELQNARRYVIWPSDPTNVATLRTQLLGFDPDTDEEISVVSGYGTMYFVSKLTLLQVLIVTTNKECMEAEPHCENNVCVDPTFLIKPEIFDPSTLSRRAGLNETRAEKDSKIQERDGSYVSQDDARPELAFISAPSTDPTRTAYWYDNTAARRVRGYLLDFDAINLNMPDFQVADSTGRTMATKAVVQVVPDGSVAQTHDDGQSHGNSMLLAMAGSYHGVGRESEMFVASTQWSYGRQTIINCLDRVEQDWISMQGSVWSVGVINLSWGWPKTNSIGAGAWEYWLSSRLKRLESSGILSVVAAGQPKVTGATEAIDTYPQLLGNPSDPMYVPNMLVVGAVDNTGAAWDQSRTATWVDVYAPGVDVASDFVNTTSGQLQAAGGAGTSWSAAFVSGLATYFMGLPDLGSTITTVAELREELVLHHSYARGGGPVAIWNGAP